MYVAVVVVRSNQNVTADTNVSLHAARENSSRGEFYFLHCLVVSVDNPLLDLYFLTSDPVALSSVSGVRSARSNKRRLIVPFGIEIPF